ncbi:MAG: glycoside hydrolase family 2 TIM barrel-domain containing protein [Paenibacillaceae bacterium]
MIRRNLDRNWRFEHGEPAPVLNKDGEQGRIVHLPHDFMIESDTFPDAPGGAATGYYGGGIGTYTKYLDIPEDAKDKRLLVEFDGSYMNTVVTLNGHKVTGHHYGYTPFHADLTPYMNPGRRNRLAVTVNNSAQPNARWYTGSGLYRSVELLSGPRVHISPWGINTHTSHIVNGTAFVVVETTVENHTATTSNLWLNIKAEKASSGVEGGNGRVSIHVPAGTKRTGRVMIAIEEAELWDIDSPHLYRITAQLYDNNTLLDEECVNFGIRTILVDVKNGFMLNGRSIKLKGGCVHHDNGILGAASYRDSEYRKMELHKCNGYNAIRCAHNPPSKHLLDACDQLGLLVINEAFDVWTMAKKPYDYSLNFAENWKTDIEAFILRDRNHPCVIMWSTGNEVNERGGLSGGYEWAIKLADWVRELDPTRPVTNSVCTFYSALEDDEQIKFYEDTNNRSKKSPGFVNFDSEYGQSIWGKYTENFCAPLDVVGYNYLPHQFEDAAKTYPNRVICSSESTARDMDYYWEGVERYSYVIGDFNWTSWDHIGEAGIGKFVYAEPDKAEELRKNLHVSPYPWRLSYSSDFDMCGFERPQLAYRRIVWGSDETFIASHPPRNYGKTELLSGWGWTECENAWNWAGDEGKFVEVDIYSAAEEVELIVNGQSLGRKLAGKKNRYKARFTLAFEPGVLEAVSYTEGKKISSDTVRTSGEPFGIRIVAEKQQLTADGQSLCFAVVEIVDEDGNLVADAELPATATVEGAATLAAFGTGRPKTEEKYTIGEHTSFKGRLLAIVRAGYESGVSILSVHVSGLPNASLEIPVTQLPR